MCGFPQLGEGIIPFESVPALSGESALGALIILKDHLMDRSLMKPAGGAVFAVTKLMYTRGRCYGAHEIKGWLDEAGFRGA